MWVPYPELRVAAVYDLAAVARTALTRNGHGAAVYPLTGPESLTQRRQAELIGEVTARPVRVEAASVEIAR